MDRLEGDRKKKKIEKYLERKRMNEEEKHVEEARKTGEFVWEKS